jgi:hypothetical protein
MVRKVYFSPKFYAQLKKQAQAFSLSVDDYVNCLIKLGLHIKSKTDKN